MRPGEPARASQSASTPEGGDDSPAVSVIVTNHNYGHFLGDCIDSILAQTHRPSEIIVVDDHSQDGSQAVLDRYSGAIRLLRTEARGQAAAFNLGFAQAGGDIVAFVDADDMLLPEALEIGLAHWSEDLALLTFGLETVDLRGRSTGLHPFSLAADEGDNRPRLLRSRSVSGPFLFAPTTGNLFGRRFLEAVLPMPEAQWRICADAHLVRAAALYGRSRALRRVLGRYRMHGANNYMRPDSFDHWSMQRCLRDLEISADALEALVHWDGMPGSADERAAVALALRLRALETRANIAAWTGAGGTLAAKVRETCVGTLRSRLPLVQRFAAVASMVRYGVVASRRRMVDPSTEEASLYPRPLLRVPGADGLEARLARLERPRLAMPLALGVTHDFGRHGPHHNALADGWNGRSWDGRCRSRGATAALEFALEPAAPGIIAEIGLAAPSELAGLNLRMAVETGGRRVWAGPLKERTTIRFGLERDRYAVHDLHRIAFTCAAGRGGAGRWWRPAGRLHFHLTHVRLEERLATPPECFLRPGERIAFAQLAGREGTEAGWEPQSDGSMLMDGLEARLRLAFEPGSRRFDLWLWPRRDMPRGWLRIHAGDGEVFAGEPGPTGPLRLHLPEPWANFGGRRIELSFGFATAPDDQERRPGFAAIALVERDPGGGLVPGSTAGGRPTLNPGQRLLIAGDGAARDVLGTGWDMPDDDGVRNTAAEATLEFALPQGIVDPVLRLALRPVLETRPDWRHVVGVSLHGAILKAAELEGEGEFFVPIPVEDLAPRCRVELVVHSAYLDDPQPGAAAPTPPWAAIELTSLALDGTLTADAGLMPDAAHGEDVEPGPFGLLAAVRAALADGGSAGPGPLVDLRGRLAGALWTLDGKALETLVEEDDAVDAIEAFGNALLGAPLTEDEAAIVAACGPSARVDDPRARLRALVLSFLLLPAFRGAVPLDLALLPALLLRRVAVVARYLGREPEFGTTEESADYIVFLEGLLEHVDGHLRREPVGTRLHDLAVETIRGLRHTKALFGPENLRRSVRLRSRCIETILRQQGFPLSMPARPRAGSGPLRLGVLVRRLEPSPEAWAVLGMYGAIDRRRFEPILILTDGAERPLATGERFARILRLEGLPADEAVRAIRALDLDVLVLGAHVANWERVAIIVAHRLARVQVTSCFNSPSTLGFESFDFALAWKGAGAEAQAQYTERLVEIDEPLQCCFDFSDVPVPAPRSVASVRREFGLPPDVPLFVSGAMAHKIQPELMAAWVEILRRTRDACLVLCPYTQWWAMRYAPDIFRARLDRLLDAAGVDRGRVIILERLPPAEYRRLLAACDIYLDSFPYAGGTTVCEAFESGLPVVTRSGPMLRERTGAVWARAFGLPRLIADSTERYVEIAVGLAGDPRRRARASAKIAARVGAGAPYADSRRFGVALSDALWRVCRETRLFADTVDEAPWLKGAALDPAIVPAVSTQKKSAKRSKIAVACERVVVAGLARTGSTMLCYLLASTPESMVDFELFHQTEIQFRSGRLRDPERIKARDADPVGWLERYHDQCRQMGYRRLGFKIFAHHDRRVLEHIARDGATRVIRLGRQNVLAQYSSQRIAEATGEWQVHGGLKPKRIRIEFDPADFERYERVIQMLRGQLVQLFEHKGTDVMDLDYTELASDAVLAQLSRFTGWEVRRTNRSVLQKQNPSRILDRFETPERVVEYLAGRGLADWAGEG
jgi:LPS sulfotransferase NodH/glycosyltransferase involved in cell wall biosynthesis